MDTSFNGVSQRVVKVWKVVGKWEGRSGFNGEHRVWWALIRREGVQVSCVTCYEASD